MGAKKIKKTMAEYKLDNFKKFSVKAAKELGYPDELKDEIINADTIMEVSRIMATARKEFWNDQV